MPVRHRPARPARRLRRPTTAAVFAIAAALVLSSCWSAQQSSAMDAANGSRTQNGLAALSGDLAAMQKAQAWSDHMAATGVLEHTGGGSSVDPSGVSNWCTYGENVGYGASIASVEAAFMNSAVHRANLLGRWDRIGVGVTTKGSVVWVTQIFLRSC